MKKYILILGMLLMAQMAWADTNTFTETETETPTYTETPTATVTETDTETLTVTDTDTETETATETATETETLTPSVTYTVTPTRTYTPGPAKALTDKYNKANVATVVSVGGTLTVTLTGDFKPPYSVNLTLKDSGPSDSVYATYTDYDGYFVITVRDRFGSAVDCSSTNQVVSWRASKP